MAYGTMYMPYLPKGGMSYGYGYGMSGMGGGGGFGNGGFMSFFFMRKCHLLPMSRGTAFHTFLHVSSAKTQISLRKRLGPNNVYCVQGKRAG